jgi:hypothetical protein
VRQGQETYKEIEEAWKLKYTSHNAPKPKKNLHKNAGQHHKKTPARRKQKQQTQQRLKLTTKTSSGIPHPFVEETQSNFQTI